MQLLIKLSLFVTLFAFHFEISGKDDNDEKLFNRYFILIRLFEFHFEISGNDDNNEQTENS